MSGGISQDFEQITTGDAGRPGNSSHETEKSPIRRILVVDDESLIRWCVAESLGAHGYAVTEASDGDAALAAAADGGPFDAVLLDFRLPDSNDLALLARLRSLVPRAQLILMTAHGSPELRQGALELGADRVIDKPFQIDDLAALVDRNRADAV
jgi:DNA-binding response OmpR family regulator